MSGFPAVNFGQSESGLFSPAEIGRLMQSEYQRSLRYGYPLSLLCVEIDRLESLHDLYGVESEQRILRAVSALLRASTRASDALGTSRGQRLLVLLPHTTREGARAIARRLLAGCRELEFRGDGRNLRASLSIGLATRPGEGGLEGGLEALAACAEEALRAAVAAGGDRSLEYEARAAPAPAPAPRPRPAEVPAAVPARAPANPGPPPLPSVHELPGATLAEKVHSLFRATGLGGELGELEREVLALLARTLGESRRPRGTRAEVLAEMRALETRIAQQKRMLDASEDELARMLQEKSVDPGVASLYKGVQGLDPATHNYQKKKDLLAVIYQANVELLRQLEQEAGPG